MLGLGAGLLALPLLPLGCGKKELECKDNGLSFDELKTRKDMGYVDKATDPAKRCELCKLYTPAAPDTCGGCQVVKGPIHPNGFCNVWAAKA
jgi:hypothetical protein